MSQHSQLKIAVMQGHQHPELPVMSLLIVPVQDIMSMHGVDKEGTSMGTAAGSA